MDITRQVPVWPEAAAMTRLDAGTVSFPEMWRVIWLCCCLGSGSRCIAQI